MITEAEPVKFKIIRKTLSFLASVTACAVVLKYGFSHRQEVVKTVAAAFVSLLDHFFS